MSPLRGALGPELRRIRHAQGRKLIEVADTAYVSHGHLSDIERGRREPSWAILTAVCDALGVSVSVRIEEQQRREEAPA